MILGCHTIRLIHIIYCIVSKTFVNHSNVISACYYTHQHSAYSHIAFNNLKFSLSFTRNKRKRKDGTIEDDGRVVGSRLIRIALSSFARLEADGGN